MCGHMARGAGEVLLLCVLSRNSRKTVLTMRLWPRKQGYHCAWCQGTRLWHHFPSSRAASNWVDLKSGPPSFIQSFMPFLYSLSLSLSLPVNTSLLFSFMQGFMPALSPQAFAYFLEQPLCLCCLRCWRNLNDVRFF